MPLQCHGWLPVYEFNPFAHAELDNPHPHTNSVISGLPLDDRRLGFVNDAITEFDHF